MKQYIGLSNDHSGSMHAIRAAACADYNRTISAIKEASIKNDIDTIVNVVQCGIRTQTGTRVVREIINSDVRRLQPKTEYIANGDSTPLWDSVGDLIDLMSCAPDADSPDVSFLVFITTDGGENSSRTWTAAKIHARVKELQATGRWTFVFRVPVGSCRHMTQYGFLEANIQEWNQTNAGFAASSEATANAFDDFYAIRASGAKASSTFYTNLNKVTAAEVKAALKDISGEVSMFHVQSHEHGIDVRSFVERATKKPLLKGAAFYQLSKTESTVQDTKVILIRNRLTGEIFYGPAARSFIGLPTSGNCRLVPGDHGDFDLYIQSTSVNRKLVSGTNVLYWARVGKAFTEGPSYQPAATAAKAQAAAPIAPVVTAQPNYGVPTGAVPKAAQVVQAPAAGTQLRLVRKKDGVFVTLANSKAHAVEIIQKAMKNKKAALMIEQSK